jgi:hypothetical protein
LATFPDTQAALHFFRKSMFSEVGSVYPLAVLGISGVVTSVVASFLQETNSKPVKAISAIVFFILIEF